MPIPYDTASDEMYALFFEAWKAGAAEFNDGEVPVVKWPYKFDGKGNPVDSVWARVSRQTVREGQAALVNGENGGRVYTSDGLLFVQIFAPLNDAKAGWRLLKLAMLARDSFRGQSTPGGVWFRNMRIQELPADAKSYQIKVVTEYQYDELGA